METEKELDDTKKKDLVNIMEPVELCELDPKDIPVVNTVQYIDVKVTALIEHLMELPKER